jgi:hypothetical protein
MEIFPFQTKNHTNSYIVGLPTRRMRQKKIIQEGNGNQNFTLPHLKLLNELGIIKLPTNFKLKETATPKAAKKKQTKQKTTQVPPKANAQGALAIF